MCNICRRTPCCCNSESCNATPRPIQYVSCPQYPPANLVGSQGPIGPTGPTLTNLYDAVSFCTDYISDYKIISLYP